MLKITLITSIKPFHRVKGLMNGTLSGPLDKSLGHKADPERGKDLR